MIVFSIIGIICGFALITIGIIRESITSVIAGIFFVLFNAGVLYFRDKEEENLGEPKAIDVYRGLTTLQITYQDSIPTDTIVVWKKR